MYYHSKVLQVIQRGGEGEGRGRGENVFEILGHSIVAG